MKKSENKLEDLYKGELFIFVRNTIKTEAEGIFNELKRNLASNHRVGSFMKTLFSGKFNIKILEDFRNKYYHYDILKIRQLFKEAALKKEPISVEDVLMHLKTLISEL